MTDTTFETTLLPTPETPKTRPPSPEPATSLAASLLTKDGHSTTTNGLRLALGSAGLFALNLSSHFADRLSLPSPWRALPSDFWLQSATLPLTVALALGLSVPGLLILLYLFDTPPRLPEVGAALCRNYFRLGLIAGGLTPALVLYQVSGADSEAISIASSLLFFGASVIAAPQLLSQLNASLQQRKIFSSALVWGWGAFLALLTGYLWLKLRILIWVN